MKTIIIGIGNPILGDDAFGWKIADHIKKLIEPATEISIEKCSLCGMALMEKMIGYDKAMLIDTINTGLYEPGTVITSTLSDIDDYSLNGSVSQHNMSTKTALQFARYLQMKVPNNNDIFIIAIEAVPVFEFGELLTVTTEKAIPVALRQVLWILEIIC